MRVVAYDIAPFIMKLFVVLSVLFLITAKQCAADPPPPLETINVTAYLGRWFQTHASLTVKWTFELGANCVTADYGPTDVEGVVTVKNIVRPLFSDFLSIQINGFAVQNPDNSTARGALSVVLGPFFNDASEVEFYDSGSYWIIAVGPVIDDRYEWAVVSDRDQSSLYILARDPAQFKELYEEEVLAMCEDMGFTTFFNRPLCTNQLFLCSY